MEQARADVALVDRLEAIRLKRSTVSEGKFDVRVAQQDYPEAFRAAGLGEEGDDAVADAAAHPAVGGPHATGGGPGRLGVGRTTS